MGFIDIAYLGGVFADRDGAVAQAVYPVRNQAEIAQVVVLEEVVLVLLKLLTEIEKLLVVNPEVADLAADLVQAFGVKSLNSR